MSECVRWWLHTDPGRCDSKGEKITLKILIQLEVTETKTHDMVSQNTHHVEIGADFDSSGQVPHYAIPIVSCREKDSGIKGVGLQNKHFILMTLYKNKIYVHIKTLGWFTKEKLDIVI